MPDVATLLLGDRPFFVPLVHRLLAFDQEVVCWVQAAVQLVCWAVFARELSLFVRWRTARVAVFTSVLCWLALDGNDWAFTVRSESLSHALLFAFLAALLGRGEEAAILLSSISAGAVLMGAMTYIGNGPNFMVKAIAEQAGVKMPSFFGYLGWSVAVLLPVLAVAALVFF